MKLTLDNLIKVKELCKCNPNEVIEIDDICYCWVVYNPHGNDITISDGVFRVDFANGWETLYI